MTSPLHNFRFDADEKKVSILGMFPRLGRGMGEDTVMLQRDK